MTMLEMSMSWQDVIKICVEAEEQEAAGSSMKSEKKIQIKLTNTLPEPSNSWRAVKKTAIKPFRNSVSIQFQQAEIAFETLKTQCPPINVL